MNIYIYIYLCFTTKKEKEKRILLLLLIQNELHQEGALRLLIFTGVVEQFPIPTYWTRDFGGFYKRRAWITDAFIERGISSPFR